MVLQSAYGPTGLPAHQAVYPGIVAAEQPDGVPEENWLPINRNDEALDMVMRIYDPDLERLTTWTPPKAEKLSP
jgi:hypothetical protein